MKRDSWLLMALGIGAAVIGGFLAFWLLLRLWYAVGFLAVAAVLIAFGWWYDRREKRARAGLPQ
jgi:Flp pilus assembly protein TadB